MSYLGPFYSRKTEQKQRGQEGTSGGDMEEKTETLNLYELKYSDLMLLSADPDSISSYSLQEQRRVESISSEVLQALGPSGPGLLSITGVPNTSSLRSKLLPLARKLALLSPDDCKRILKEHGLGSDVPLKNVERRVSSFATQLKYLHDLGLTPDIGERGPDGNHHMDAANSDGGNLGNSLLENELKDLGNMFKKLGICMMELGIRLARICDRAIGGEELEQSLLESCSAKGRLIHYHSALDNIVLKEAGRQKGSNNRQRNSKSKQENSSRATQLPERAISSSICGNEVGSENSSNLWQQWHYDFGVFTVLTDPLFIVSHPPQSVNDKEEPPMPCEQECPSPSGHTCLQIFNSRHSSVQVIKSSPESFIVQVGEAADILTKGRLRGTLHSVCKPEGFRNLSRETFVVFLQPAWTKTLSTADYPTTQLREELELQDTRSGEFQTIVPPLSSRVKDGMTFAEFSRETTKQYYGGSGLQSSKRGC